MKDECDLMRDIWESSEAEHAAAKYDKNNKIKICVSERRSYKKHRRLSLDERMDILHTNDNPRKVLSAYNISYSTLRGIKEGRDSCGVTGGSKEHWYAYAGRHRRSIHRLEGLRKEQIQSSLHDPKEALMDVLTSSEPPSVLVARWGYRLSTIRQMKSGKSYYAGKGGCPELWDDYHALHFKEWQRLSRADR